MNDLETIEKINSIEDLLFHAEQFPLQKITTPEDIFAAPDYNETKVSLIEKALHISHVVTLFADSSGFGTDSEPALTPDQLRNTVANLLSEHDNLSCCITDIGQFQVYISIFKS
jgi:hypothetical protein